MTRLPSSDAFLASGGFDTKMLAAPCYANGSSSSIISPSTATDHRYSSLPPRLSNGSPAASLPPTSSSVSCLPHAGSLSSDTGAFRKPASPYYLVQNGDGAAPASLSPSLDTPTTLSRSVSADGAAPQQSPPLHLVQRLAQQNALVREAWEAERNYLEANRRRAEEVYQEECAIMEDIREVWHNEKADMLREMQALRERIQRLEAENSALKAVATQVTAVLTPLISQRGDSIDSIDSIDSSAESPSYFSITLGAMASASSQNKPHRMPNSISSADAAASLPPGLDGASRRPHFASSGSSRTSPPKLPESSPSILDPRTQPETSSPRDFLVTSSENPEKPVPVIDVQEIDPKLEGISLKATAVQKSTFAELSKKSPSVTSPPAKANNARQLKPLRSVFGKRGSSKEQTMQILAAEESRRLTMHAGHTPNHSLSLFPTMTTATETNTATGRSEGTTPTATASAPPEWEQEDGRRDGLGHNGQNGENCNGKHPDASLLDGEAGDPDQPLMEPTDDVPLKGPLMVKNIPAQDELFWAALNKKLEPISQGQDALPTVMQIPIAELDATPQRQGMHVAPVGGGDASHDSHAAVLGDDNDDDDDDDDDLGKKTMEADVPLKFKTTTNFGAPFGMMM